MANKRTFDKDYLVDELDLPFRCIWSEEFDKGRWMSYHRGVFQEDGKFWMVEWEEGLTEMQDNEIWEDYDEVEATEVEKVEKTVVVTDWVPVP